jgi:SRSO17 transposase
MTTAEQRDAPYASELRLLSQAAEALDEVQERIGHRFRRAEARRRARRFLEGLLAPVERKNGWQLAAALNERGPHGVQRLLAEADWDQEAVRDDLRTYILAHLGADRGVLVVDETGLLKKGKKSAGVAPQYSGTAGGRANCQIGVFLLYASHTGAAFIDRELYLPDEWTEDRVRCREAGIPSSVGFATTAELAQRMLARTFAAGVRAAWVLGDPI